MKGNEGPLARPTGSDRGTAGEKRNMRYKKVVGLGKPRRKGMQTRARACSARGATRTGEREGNAMKIREKGRKRSLPIRGRRKKSGRSLNC